MGKDSNTRERASRQHPPTKIIVRFQMLSTRYDSEQEELTAKIINQLIEKIFVSEPVEIDGQKIQRLTIH